MTFPVKFVTICFTKRRLEKRLNVHKYNNKECTALKTHRKKKQRIVLIIMTTNILKRKIKKTITYSIY